MATAAQRKHVGSVLDELWKFRAHLGYPKNDVRTSLDATFWHLTESQAFTLLAAGHYLQCDCSQMFAWVLKCAGLWHWGQPGYTGTDLDVCQPHYTDARLALVGAGAIYGTGTGHHVSMTWVPDPKGGNPMQFSHGRAGVDRITLKDEAARQAASGHPGVRMVSIAHL